MIPAAHVAREPADLRCVDLAHHVKGMAPL